MVTGRPGAIETERLLLRLAEHEDIGTLARVAEARTTDRISATIESQPAVWEQHGYGLWVIVPRMEMRLVGWCGLKPGSTPHKPEIMFGLEAESRRQGFATEAVRAVIAFALARPDVESVWGATATGNLASAAVMKRAGMVLETAGALDGVPSFIFRVARGAS